MLGFFLIKALEGPKQIYAAQEARRIMLYFMNYPDDVLI